MTEVDLSLPHFLSSGLDPNAEVFDEQELMKFFLNDQAQDGLFSDVNNEAFPAPFQMNFHNVKTEHFTPPSSPMGGPPSPGFSSSLEASPEHAFQVNGLQDPIPYLSLNEVAKEPLMPLDTNNLFNMMEVETTIAPNQLHCENQSFLASLAPQPSPQPLSILPTLEIKPEQEEEEKPKTTRKRKRRRKVEPHVPTAVTLPRAQLLKISSKELEDMAERIRETRNLTVEEEKDLRRQRRLIKNRESAQLSRQRRKEHIDELENTVKMMGEENAALKAQVAQLTQENSTLKTQLHTVLRESPPSFSDRLKNLISVGLDNHKNTTLASKASSAAKATYLLIIILSFGLFFNNLQSNPMNSPITFEQPKVQIFEDHVADNLPTGRAGARKLLWVDESATDMDLSSRAERTFFDEDVFDEPLRDSEVPVQPKVQPEQTGLDIDLLRAELQEQIGMEHANYSTEVHRDSLEDLDDRPTKRMRFNSSDDADEAVASDTTYIVTPSAATISPAFAKSSLKPGSPLVFFMKSDLFLFDDLPKSSVVQLTTVVTDVKHFCGTHQLFPCESS
eukprot:CAMPEP_0174260904 /NCGR_PEP_ID=MMETSP0439-20130205/10949_1 /TAXON_ID=0 /ORGANISM="Stereomyxa ramosa, Strain Chinc5" /LENGTH=560 /DNA_ID=CAMNT_0015345279 /DNA_START=60 /DNA_END=1742 /DNA_ORIENTATION=+